MIARRTFLGTAGAALLVPAATEFDLADMNAEFQGPFRKGDMLGLPLAYPHLRAAARALANPAIEHRYWITLASGDGDQVIRFEQRHYEVRS